MNNLKKHSFVFVVLTVFLSTPFISLAQTSSTDGSNDGTTTRSNYVKYWRQGNAELQGKISQLSTTPVQSVFIPVLFGVELNNISPNFGDPRSNGRSHAGEDIMAVLGTPIVSPTPAVVLRIGVGSGEGNYVYTANPGGETFVYMHLDKFGEGVVAGTVLEKGSLIGYVGNTGNASGGAAHLHFEIHDSNGTPLDPFPRLTGTFTNEEKNTYLTKILSQSTDSTALSVLLVNNFRSTFNKIQSSGIVLPKLISDYMISLPIVTSTTSTISVLPAGDLALNSKGSGVVSLQQFLIAKNTGPLAARLSIAGATGNFGPLTQSALIEYQISIGVIPSDGYYGPTTRSFVEKGGTPSPATNVVTNNTTSLGITRNLYKTIVGDDVRALQKFLNTHGYLVATTGAGSLGNESNYFGQATANAVIRFQITNNISPAVGYVGPVTRTLLNSL